MNLFQQKSKYLNFPRASRSASRRTLERLFKLSGISPVRLLPEISSNARYGRFPISDGRVPLMPASLRSSSVTRPVSASVSSCPPKVTPAHSPMLTVGALPQVRSGLSKATFLFA